MRIFSHPTPSFNDTNAQATARPNRFSVHRTAGTMPIYTPKTLKAEFAPESASTKISTESAQKPGFKDLIDVINPLQHIPVVNFIYRKLTGDEISPMAQFSGGVLYGGPLGGALAIGDIALRESTGKGFSDTMVSMVSTRDTPEAPETPVIQLAKRWASPERMAGLQPVWNRNLAPDTDFALILQRNAEQNINIS